MTTPRTLVTVFYSNYSGNCKALLQQINNSNLMDNLSLKFINIDNDIIRQLCLKKFLVVPAIVVMLNDEISLYTGNNAFEWFNTFSQTQIETSSIPSGLNDKESIKLEKTKTIMEMADEISKARDKF